MITHTANAEYKYMGARKMNKKLINISQILSEYCNSIDCDMCPFDRIVSDECRCPIDRTRSALREILQADGSIRTSEQQIDYCDTEAEYYQWHYERLRSLIKDLAEKADFVVSEKPEPILDVSDEEDE